MIIGKSVTVKVAEDQDQDLSLPLPRLVGIDSLQTMLYLLRNLMMGSITVQRGWAQVLIVMRGLLSDSVTMPFK